MLSYLLCTEWIKTRYWELWHFPICLYREAICLQCFPPTCYMSGRGHTHTCVHVYMCTCVHNGLYPICSKLLYRLPACTMWLYYACSYTVAISSGRIPSLANHVPRPSHVFQCFHMKHWKAWEGLATRLSLAVLYTEKLAFQCTTLLSWE